MVASIDLNKLPKNGVNADISFDDNNKGLQVKRVSDGRFGVDLSVPFYSNGLTTISAELQLDAEAQVTFEAHGFVSRFQKLRASISGNGDLLHAGDELVSAQCSRNGEVVSVQLTFHANNTRNESFYVFCDPGCDKFTLLDFTFEHPEPEYPDISSLGDSVHFEVQDLFVFRNYLQIDFELLKANADLTTLALDCPLQVQASQWWTDWPVKVAPDSALIPRTPIGKLPSPVAMQRYGAAYGNHGHSIRLFFEDFQDFRYIDVATSDAVVEALKLRCCFSDGSSEELAVKLRDELPHPLRETTELIASVVADAKGQRPQLLELGGRGEVSRHIRENVAIGCDYCSIDIDPGPNVDLVGDVHRMSELFPAKYFDIIYSHSVMEHLIVPWQMIIEANKILKTGGYFVAYVPTTWPLHAEPWDFWRMSSHAWPSLLNDLTGFHICKVEEIGKAAIVPSALKISGNTRMQHDPSPLFTSVIAKKISEPRVHWESLGVGHASGRYAP